jgi:hypothetical protein
MSFVDVMGNDRWTDEAITDRTEDMIAGAFSPKRQLILIRMTLGVLLGHYQFSQAEQQELGAYMQASMQAGAAAADARADWALLEPVLNVEAQATELANLTTEQLALFNARAAARQAASMTPIAEANP